MIFTKTTVTNPLLVRGKTRFPGFEVCPAEFLVNTEQELARGKISEPEPFLTDGNVWSTEPKDVATLFHGVTHEFIRDWGAKLYQMEKEHPGHPGSVNEEGEPVPSGRPEMLEAIRNEMLRRRDPSYHKNNQE